MNDLVLFMATTKRVFLGIDLPDDLKEKIEQLKTLLKARHLKQGIPIFVVESGQYRICFREKGKAREILFAGNHKQYQKWYKQFF